VSDRKTVITILFTTTTVVHEVLTAEAERRGITISDMVNIALGYGLAEIGRQKQEDSTSE
jgi:hypothetical protein